MSDLHACSAPNAEGSVRSFLDMRVPEDAPTGHIITALISRIRKDGITADYLLCPGDMGDCASAQAITYAWTQVNKVGQALGAVVIATAGNHDLDSRHTGPDIDSREHLVDLVPPFPVPMAANDRSFETENLRYWARNYMIFDRTHGKYTVRFLNLNSSAYHGASSRDEKNPEYLHGRISHKTIARIKKDLSARQRADLCVMLCHHHPHRHLDRGEDDTVMKEGTKLIDLLASDGGGRWLLIHGHKHQPRISYAAGASSQPVVFGAGSFSAKPLQDQPETAQNQFYILDFPLSKLSKLKLEIACKFESWNWTADTWTIGDDCGPGLPGRGGFGYRTDIYPLASDVAALVKRLMKENSEAYVEYGAILRKMPRLEYLLPSDQQRLVEKIQALGISLEFERGHRYLPKQLAPGRG